MKPFNNVIVSATEPKNADVWIKHSKNLLRLNDYTESKSGLTLTVKNNVIKITGSGSDTFYLDKIINFTDLANKIKGKTITLSSTDINYCSFTLATGQSPYFLQLGTLIDELRKKQTKEITEDLAYGSIYVPEKTNEQTIEFKLQIEFGDTATDWQEPLDDDILVNDNGVYNSVLTKKISTGIEIKTNRRIDGKDIYYKRIDLGTGPNATSKAYSIGINFNNIVDSNVFAKDSTSSFKLPFLAQSAQEFINYYFQSNQIIIQAGKDRSKYNFYLDIYYTK